MPKKRKRASVGSGQGATPPSKIKTNPNLATQAVSSSGSAASISKQAMRARLLRRDYSRYSYTMSTSLHHAEFLSDCLKHGYTPKGLRIRLKVHAHKALETDILTLWKEKTKETEYYLMDILTKHYTTIAKTYQKKLEETKQQLDANLELKQEEALQHDLPNQTTKWPGVR